MTKEEFLLRKQELADKLFDLARGFEELMDKAEEESSSSDISDEDLKEFEDLIDELEKEDCDNDI